MASPTQLLPPTKRAVLLATPPVLVASTWLAFPAFARRFGPRRGYFLGFACYWLGWCFLVPLWLLGPDRLRRLFAGRWPRGGEWLALAAPPLLGYTAAFPRQVQQADAVTVLASAAIAVVNAAGEELLWRGAYVDAFSDDPVLGYLYPAAGFAVWHFAPQAVYPNPRPGGAASLVAVSGAVGLLYGWVARRRRSIHWTTLSHALFDFAGLGALNYRR
jgi:membrane protease YdiL (CAAX protease family)